MNKDILTEMLNPEYPLLIKFKENAPGTFQHCENVSQLCGKIGIALKLDCDFLKTVGMYHDLGKMLYPMYYCENQSKNSNVHDTLDPIISAHMIISHVANTVSLLIDRVDNIPIEIIKCVSMHHGDTVCVSMLNKVEESKRHAVIKQFTYPYTKPIDVYACTLMICDTVDATLKGLMAAGKVTSDNIAETICGIIKKLTDAQQLDELTFKQGRIITDILISEYNAVDHKRVTTEYNDSKQ